MLKTEEWLLIRDLYSQGFCISEISRKTGFDRKTVRKYLRLKTLPEPQKRSGRKSKLDPFKPYIVEKLKEGPYTAVRLYREIKEMGFDGGKTIVKDFVREVLPKQGVRAVLRYETKPIVQAQVYFILGNKYSVPYRFAGRTAELHTFEGKFEVYVDYEKVCEREVLPGNCRVARKKEHFQGLLSKILKENSKYRKDSQIPLKFSDPEVKKRFLDVYEALSEGGFE